MSQADTQLADPGDDSIEDMAGASIAEEVEQEEEEVEGEDPEAEQEEEVAEEQADDDPEYEWEAGGQTFKVKQSELRAGYMKDADYRRKTAEVAEQRRQVEQVAQQVQQQRQMYATQLDVYLGSLHKELVGSQPDPKLIEDDPQEFMRQQAAYNTRAQQFQQAMQYRQAVAAHQQQDEQRALAETIEQENRLLLDKMPELREEKTRTAAFSDVAKFLSGLGYSPEELNQLTDHRALMVAMKAAKYDQLQAAKAKQAKPPVPKPVRPGAAGTTTQTRAQKAHERLRRNPNDFDALVALSLESKD